MTEIVIHDQTAVKREAGLASLNCLVGTWQVSGPDDLRGTSATSG